MQKSALKKLGYLSVAGFTAMLILCGGCGKVGNSVLSRNDGPPANNSQPAAEQISSAEFIYSIKDILRNYSAGLTASEGLPLNETQARQLASAFQASSDSFAAAAGLSAQDINFDDEFPHWNYTSGSSGLAGGLTQSFEHKFRYHKPDETYIQKKVEQFSAEDWNDYNYIEDLQIITIQQAGKTILTLWY
ncbi:MAG: hypothetical protein LBD99_06650, partial [Candidatus Margulisbacteria bacterium]|nr:hypothetical protein [Candidatus Margulisiibacteriota bacterium]